MTKSAGRDDAAGVLIRARVRPSDDRGSRFWQNKSKKAPQSMGYV